MNGKSEMKRLNIDPSLFKPEEAEIVEDLIVAASTTPARRPSRRLPTRCAR